MVLVSSFPTVSHARERLLTNLCYRLRRCETAPSQTSCEDEDGPRGSALRDAGPPVREGEAMQTAAALSMCQAILRTCQAGGHGMIRGEPKLDDLLAEPIVLLRAKSAGLSPEELRALCVRLRTRLVQR